jgi:hypothetical protein
VVVAFVLSQNQRRSIACALLCRNDSALAPSFNHPRRDGAAPWASLDGSTAQRSARPAVGCLTSIPTSCWVSQNGSLSVNRSKNRVVSVQGFLTDLGGIETVIGGGTSA